MQNFPYVCKFWSRLNSVGHKIVTFIWYKPYVKTLKTETCFLSRIHFIQELSTEMTIKRWDMNHGLIHLKFWLLTKTVKLAQQLSCACSQFSTGFSKSFILLDKLNSSIVYSTYNWQFLRSKFANVFLRRSLWKYGICKGEQEKLEIPGGWGVFKEPPGMEIPGGGESKVKNLPWGVWIFSGATY